MPEAVLHIMLESEPVIWVFSLMVAEDGFLSCVLFQADFGQESHSGNQFPDMASSSHIGNGDCPMGSASENPKALVMICLYVSRYLQERDWSIPYHPQGQWLSIRGSQPPRGHIADNPAPQIFALQFITVAKFTVLK